MLKAATKKAIIDSVLYPLTPKIIPPTKAVVLIMLATTIPKPDQK